MNKNLANQFYWESTYAQLNFPEINTTNPIAKLIRKYFTGQTGRVFEVGCFPGNFLPVFGQLGYEINGIDQTARTSTDLAAWLKEKTFTVGDLITGDFLTFDNSQKYDLVCSFGFIEHFQDPVEIIKRHDHFVKPGGYLMITFPNFRGVIQRILHLAVDRQNYQRHNIEAMDLKRWEKLLTTTGYEIIYSGWFGGFDFWVEEQPRNLVTKISLGFLLKICYILKKIKWPGSALYSPFGGLIAKKIN